MYKFKFKDKFVLDVDAPSALVIKEQYAPEVLQEIISAYAEEFKTYLDNNVAYHEKMCKMFGINESNYARQGFFQKSMYDRYVDFKSAREEAESVKVLFDISAFKNGFEYLAETLPQIDFGETKPTISLAFVGEEETIHGRMPDILSAEEFEQVKACERSLVESGVVDQIFIQEGDEGERFTIKQVEDANKFVKIIADEVKSLNLSPFETVVYIHDKCSQFFYNWHDKMAGTNVLPDILASGNIRCVGYATMFKAVIDELDIPELKAELCGCFGVKKEGHALNTVTIKDDKYGINGQYMQDVCFSALSQAKEKTDFAYCLFPVDDFIDMYAGDYRVIDNVNLKEYYDLEHKHPIGLSRMEDDKAHEFLENAHKEFLASIKTKGLPIAVEKYAEAYYVGLIQSGVSEQDAKMMVDEKINHTIALTSTILNPETAKSEFFRENVSEEFLREFLTEYQFIDYELKTLEKINLDELTEDEANEKRELIRALRRKKDALLSSLEEGNKYNQNLIKTIIEKN